MPCIASLPSIGQRAGDRRHSSQGTTKANSNVGMKDDERGQIEKRQTDTEEVGFVTPNQSRTQAPGSANPNRRELSGAGAHVGLLEVSAVL